MTARFSAGDRVRVDARDQPGHVRTPHYVRGKQGRVLEVCGAYPNPERLAQGESGVPHQYLYRVIFEWRDVWAGEPDHGKNRLAVDIYEHWLEALEDAR
jgi:hypothetical protein